MNDKMIVTVMSVGLTMLAVAPVRAADVGIGTTSPAVRLDVNGAARTTTLEITGGPLQGRLAGWGSNFEGQTNVPAGTFIGIAAGNFHSLAIRSDGTLAGWGQNNFGQINVPASTFVAVAAGELHSLAIRSDGTLVGWGNNANGQIDVPAAIYVAADGCSGHSLGCGGDGTLAGWGQNNFGQINVPAGTFIGVAAGYLYSLGIHSDGTLAGWGYNFEGQINVPNGTFTAVAAGASHGLAIRSDGTLAGWGYNGNGQINVPAGTFTTVVAGAYHSLAIRSPEVSTSPVDPSAPHDRPKNRYLSFAPSNGSVTVAFRVDKTTAPTGPCWVDAPDVMGNAKCVASPVFRVWPEAVVHVGDCEIIPVALYEIRATLDGVAFTAPLTVSTIAEPVFNGKKWGDTVGINNGSEWTPPNQFTNVNDVLAILAYISAAVIKPHFTVANLQAISSADSCLNAFVNTSDVLISVRAIAGDSYGPPATGKITDPALCPVCP